MEVTDEMAAEFIAAWNAAGSPPLPITVHHVPDDLPVAERQQAAQAVGWIEDLRPGERDNALEGRIAWNDEGKALVAGDKYRFLSPEWSEQHVDRRSGTLGGPWLFGAALLNDPFFHSMPRVAASRVPPTKEHPMLKHLAALLALSATATEADVIAAVEKLNADRSDAETKLTAAATATAKLTALESAVESLKASNVDTTKKLAETTKLLADAQAKAADAELGALMDAAKREGKAITDALRASIVTLAKACGLDEAKKLIAGLPVSVKVGQETAITAGSNTGGSNSETAKAEYHRLMDEKVKAGATPQAALNLIRREHPAVYAAAMKAPPRAAPIEEN